MAVAHFVTRSTSPNEALGFVTDRRNWGFRIGMEMGSKHYDYDVAGNLTDIYWTIVTPTTGAAANVTRIFRKHFDWSSAPLPIRLDDEAEWVEVTPP